MDANRKAVLVTDFIKRSGKINPLIPYEGFSRATLYNKTQHLRIDK
jgi:hypothetical protein